VTSASIGQSSAWRRVPWARDYLAHEDHGPLPALLLLLTVATGIVDAVSILALGRVFVANMTGNIAFIGFALAGAPGFSLAASVTALAGFLCGAALCGFALNRFRPRRGVLLRNVVAAELTLVLAAAAIAAASGTPLAGGVRALVVALMAIGLGMQNTAVRHLAVPDLTTTVLTMSLTGLAADIRARNLRVALRRALSVGCMLAGAFAGALVVLRVSPAAGLFTAAAVLAVTTAGAAAASGDAPWQQAQKKVPAQK
jgi:uncharacterized membrane protein YoaK (UPF0700 family)